MNDFEKSLKALDLQGLILVMGLLCQRALEVIAEQKSEPKIKVPEKKLIL